MYTNISIDNLLSLEKVSFLIPCMCEQIKINRGNHPPEIISMIGKIARCLDILTGRTCSNGVAENPFEAEPWVICALAI